MSAEGLQIRVSSDMATALKSLDQLRKQLNEAANQGEGALKRLVESFGKVDASATATTGVIGKLQNQLKNFKDGLKFAQSEESIARLNRAIEATQSRLKSLQSIRSPFDNVRKGTSEAQMTLMNFNRVVQDAPYGIMGIANNIDPLVASFQQLKVQTGSVSGAFSAMASSLAGPAGIAIAVSAATSLLVKFGDDLFSSKSKAEELAKAIKSIGEAADVANDSIGDMRSMLQMFNTIDPLRINLRLGATEGNDIPIMERQISRIEDELIPKLLKVRETLDAASAELVRRSVAAKVGSEEAKLIEEELQKINEAFKKSFDEEADLRFQSGILSMKIDLQKLKNQEEANEKAEELRNKELEAWRRHTEGMRRAQEQIAAMYQKIVIGDVDFKMVPFEIPKIDVQKMFMESGRQSLEKPVPIPILFTAEQTQENVWWSDVNKVFTDMMVKFREAKAKFPTIDLAQFINEGGAENLQALLNTQLVNLTSFAEQAREIMGALGEDLAISVGEGIGNILSGGGIKEAFGGIFQSLGAALQRLGAVMIATSKAMAKFKAAFATMSVTGQLAAGVGLVALGTLVKNAAANATPFANGGIVYGPTNALVGEYAGARHNPEVIAPLNKLKEMIRPGGGEFPQYLPAVRLEGSTLLIMYERAMRQNGRYS